MSNLEVQALIGELVETGLPELLKNEEVCTAFKEGLKEAGCYPPSHIIVFAILKKVLVIGWGFGGEAIKSRLLQWFSKNKTLYGWLEGVAKVCKDHQEKSTLQTAMLEHLQQRGAEGAGVVPDAVTDFDVLKQLYSATRFDEISDDLAEITALLQDFLVGHSADPIGQHLGWDRGSDLTLADAIKHNSGKYDFVGRDAEINMLHRFCGDVSMGNRFSWLLITGPGGEGKTRLARQFTTVSIDDNWRAGRLTINDLKSFDHPSWFPSRPTFIVIDYPASAPDEVAALLRNFARRRDAFDWPVRVLLLERKADGEWFNTVSSPDTGGAAVRSCVHRIDGVPKLEGVELPPMELADVVRMMMSRFVGAGLEPPKPETLAFAAFKTDPRVTNVGEEQELYPRPLFAAAVAEVMFDAMKRGEAVDGEWAKRLDRDGILSSIIERDRKFHWEPAANDNAPILSSHENLLALATLAGGFSKAGLRKLDADLQEFLPEARDTSPLAWQDNLVQTMSGYVGGSAMPLEPDLLGEFFLLQKLERIEESLGVEGRQAFCAAALSHGGDRAAEPLLRTVFDFPEKAASIGWMLPAPDSSIEALKPAIGATVDIIGRLGAEAMDIADWIVASKEQGLNDYKVAEIQSKSVVNVVLHASRIKEWDRVDDMLVLMDTLRRAYVDDTAIAVNQAQAAVNITSSASKSGNWPRVNAMLDLLAGLRTEFVGHQPIAVEQAKAVVNIANTQVEEGDWRKVESVLELLANIRAEFEGDPDIALREAMALVNAANNAGKLEDWERVDTWMAPIAILRQDFANDAGIALEQSKAAVNVIREASKKEYWPRVDKMLETLESLRQEFPDDSEIALRHAMGAVNVTASAGKAGEWHRVVAALAILADLRDEFEFHSEIALRQARAVVNVTNHAGDACKWDLIDDMLVVGRELLIGPHQQTVLEPLSRLWRYAVQDYFTHHVAPKPELVEEFSNFTVFILDKGTKKLLEEVAPSLRLIKHCSLNGYAEQTQKCIETLTEVGLDWAEIQPLKF